MCVCCCLSVFSGTIRVWDRSSGRCIRVLYGQHDCDIKCIVARLSGDFISADASGKINYWVFNDKKNEQYKHAAQIEDEDMLKENCTVM